MMLKNTRLIPSALSLLILVIPPQREKGKDFLKSYLLTTVTKRATICIVSYDIWRSNYFFVGEGISFAFIKGHTNFILHDSG